MIRNTFLIRCILALILLPVAGTTVLAQNDAEGCKDHPLFNRMPNTYIGECSQNFNEMEIQSGENSHIKKEGMKTSINYVYDTEKPGVAPSFFQIVKNYENALARNGGKKLHYQNGGTATLYAKTTSKEVWVVLEDYTSTNGDGNFAINILEIEAMKQEIQASAILDALNASGHIALYINFETGKSAIKTESQKIIDQLVQMLVGNPALNIRIEGHTDNAGTAASNQTLSVNRANAVMAAIVNKGINKSRLSAKGLGQTNPIADNNTDAGRALNRRVEIVKE